MQYMIGVVAYIYILNYNSQFKPSDKADELMKNERILKLYFGMQLYKLMCLNEIFSTNVVCWVYSITRRDLILISYAFDVF